MSETHRLVLGTAQFGMPYGITNTQGRVSSPEVTRILDLARSMGVRMLDTAVAYGDSERVLGDASDVRRPWRVITKLPAVPDGVEIYRWMRDTLTGSLERLRVAQLEAVLLHRPDQLLGPRRGEIYAALREVQQSGLALRVGISIYAPEELDRLPPEFSFDVVQSPFNVFDRRLEASGWLDRLADAGVEVHVRSVFLQGLLLKSGSELPAQFARWRAHWRQLEDWSRTLGGSQLQACIAFVAARRTIGGIVTGVESTVQLQEILDGLSADIGSVDAVGLECSEPALIDPRQWQRP